MHRLGQPQRDTDSAGADDVRKLRIVVAGVPPMQVLLGWEF